MIIPIFYHHALRKIRVPFHFRTYARHKNPFFKTVEIISNDVPVLFGGKAKNIYPEHVDVVIIGGGYIGSAVAHSLKTRTAEGISVVVLEKDMTYRDIQRNVSLGSLVHHFSLPENVYLSQYGEEFLRNIKEHLGKHIDIQYQPCKNLVLACEKYAHKMEENVILQREFGLKNEILTTNDINNRYPWLNTHDVKLGCLGIEGEGIFNAAELLKGLVCKAQELGAMYINAEVIGFELEKQRDVLMEGVAPGTFERINKVVYRTPDNEEHELKFAVCVLAAGHNSSNIGKMAKIGIGEGLLSVPLPVEERSFNVYTLEGKANDTGLSTPLITDTSGMWLQRNGLQSNLLCGHIPLKNEETKHFTEEEYYMNVVKPSLVNRISNLDKTEIVRFNAEKQDCNLYDYTGFLGPHPYHNNLYIAAGFGKQGCIHAPGLGRAITELIVDSQFTTIDLSRFGFDRLLVNEPLLEFNVY